MPMPDRGLADREQSPFGGDAVLAGSISTAELQRLYRDKCGADVARFFGDRARLNLYECPRTGMRFWRPASVAGDEAFYADLSLKWPNYYQVERWEYPRARAVIPTRSRVLEVGCGRGYFLRSLEGHAADAVGLELNKEAIDSKVTSFEIQNVLLEQLSSTAPAGFDAVCSFQVLEHVTDPAAFLRSCLACLRPEGLLILSTPNYATDRHRNMEDAFDLPPHHLSHFDAKTYRRIADLFGLKLVSVESQNVEQPARQLPMNDAHSPLHRKLRALANRSLLRIWGTRTRPGHTLLAVLQKTA